LIKHPLIIGVVIATQMRQASMIFYRPALKTHAGNNDYAKYRLGWEKQLAYQNRDTG